MESTSLACSCYSCDGGLRPLAYGRRKGLCRTHDLMWVSALRTPAANSEDLRLREGPSCVFVGPVETAKKARLEALYQQARDSYYSGQPLIVDDMFDKVELRLRWHGSKLVVKYPRCSLKRLSVYADAEVDHSQVWALASIWMMLLALGLLTSIGPPIYYIHKIFKDGVVFHVLTHRLSLSNFIEILMAFNVFGAFFMGFTVGIPLTMASMRALHGLWKGDLIALKGPCPSCGEEVFAFVRTEISSNSSSRHKSECHVCEHPLIFDAKVERSSTHVGWPWAYGRVYLVTRSRDLVPP